MILFFPEDLREQVKSRSLRNLVSCLIIPACLPALEIPTTLVTMVIATGTIATGFEEICWLSSFPLPKHIWTHAFHALLHVPAPPTSDGEETCFYETPPNIPNCLPHTPFSLSTGFGCFPFMLFFALLLSVSRIPRFKKQQQET